MCRRTFCLDCDEELIHRDHRKSYESASALGQILHRQGPAEITVGDVDLLCAKWRGSPRDRCRCGTLRVIEHKQPDQSMGALQRRALEALDEAIQIAINHPSETLRLTPESGVHIVRGHLDPAISRRREVEFHGAQTITKLDGAVVFAPKTRIQFYDWLNCGPGWTSRGGRARYGG